MKKAPAGKSRLTLLMSSLRKRKRLKFQSYPLLASTFRKYKYSTPKKGCKFFLCHSVVTYLSYPWRRQIDIIRSCRAPIRLEPMPATTPGKTANRLPNTIPKTQRESTYKACKDTYDSTDKLNHALQNQQRKQQNSEYDLQQDTDNSPQHVQYNHGLSPFV